MFETLTETYAKADKPVTFNTITTVDLYMAIRRCGIANPYLDTVFFILATTPYNVVQFTHTNEPCLEISYIFIEEANSERIYMVTSTHLTCTHIHTYIQIYCLQGFSRLLSLLLSLYNSDAAGNG